MPAAQQLASITSNEQEEYDEMLRKRKMAIHAAETDHVLSSTDRQIINILNKPLKETLAQLLSMDSGSKSAELADIRRE